MATTSDNLQKRGRAATKKARGAAAKVRSDAAPVIKRVSGQAWEGLGQGLEAIDDKARQARDASVKASKSVVAYTKKKPIRALAIAAASGALLHAALNIFRPSREKQSGARNR
jgi:ElaB/YqjD/DUF883 family membrane-anchored ribosome-binding protein